MSALDLLVRLQQRGPVPIRVLSIRESFEWRLENEARGALYLFDSGVIARLMRLRRITVIDILMARRWWP